MGEDRGIAGLYCVQRSMVAGKPLKEAHDKAYSLVCQLSRRARTQHLAQDETAIECADVEQQTLQNVVMPA